MSNGRSLLKALASRAPGLATLVALGFTMAAALTMSPAQAQVVAPAAATAATPATTAAPSPIFGMMQGLVGLVIVIVVIYAAAWLLKKIGPRARSTGVVQVVGGASVGPREKVVVVRFDGQTLLLGVAPGRVSLLHTADPGSPTGVDEPISGAPRFIDRLRAAKGTP